MPGLPALAAHSLDRALGSNVPCCGGGAESVDDRILSQALGKLHTRLAAVAADAGGGAFLGQMAWLAAVGAQSLVRALVLAMPVSDGC